ncbi:hypothetical protein F8568_006360 [Actinomadura sp. LD22]|uniref:DUF11 domain-containing protein n=1 Tax=Actinomadura physcomitrii TaxID=2650748 RepID=A0A6I4M2M3_9ACTN|nr:DUF11 domain-containing protein [Actinomadura physcomitrii]MWA00003.1 hypothetical protein [Actinomadura physcomitrii]
MTGKKTRRVGARGLAVLAAAPLLGVVPLMGAAGGARADGPGPSGHGGQHAHKGKGRGRPAPHHKPVKHRPPVKHREPAGHKKKARSVRLHTSAPGKAVLPGRTYDWPFAVTAKGHGKAGRAVFRATLPKSLEFVSGRRDCAVSGWTVECDLGAVRPGQTVAGAIRAKVAGRARPDEAIWIPATVTWRGRRDAAEFPVARVARTADLAIAKTAPATARSGAPISYVLRVSNRGPATAEDVFVRASGPVRLLTGNAACIPEERGFVCGVGALRPGETRTLRFRVLPAGNVRAGKVLTFASRVTSSTTDPNPRNNSATVRTRITAKKAAPKKKAPKKKAYAGAPQTKRAGAK